MLVLIDFLHELVPGIYMRGVDIYLPFLRRSEEHTSELQSQPNLVCRLLLEKKNTPVLVLSHNSGTIEKEKALALIQQMLGPDAEFREGQWQSIDLVANPRPRLPVVPRTGLG